MLVKRRKSKAHSLLPPGPQHHPGAALPPCSAAVQGSTTDKGCNQRGERTGALLKGPATVSVGPVTDHHVASGTSLPAQGPVCTKMGLLRASGFGLCAPKSLGVSLLSQ